MVKIKVFLAIIVLLGLAFVFSSKALAEDSGNRSPEPTSTPKVSTTLFSFSNEGKETPEPTEKPDDEESESPEPSETPRVKGIDRLEGKRLEFCENHQEEVDTRLNSLGRLVANILGKFDAIAARVQQFYTTKVLPSGKTVANYDALIADIAAKKAAVNTALSNTQADINGFDCNADNPKGQIRLFRTDMQAVKEALHDYRTSIKNLIVAVKSVIGEDESENESPNPSATPAATPTLVPTASPSI